MAKRRRPGPKRVVYLWGAGATQAEVTYLGAHNVNLLMRDGDDVGEGVATRILKRLPKRWQSAFLVDRGADIEKLISLLTASNVNAYARLANQIRRLYFEDLRDNLALSKVLRNPQLASGLISLHRNHEFKNHEVLSGIISTNHDGLLQLASQQVHGMVNIGIAFASSELTPTVGTSPPILQLHGSFTWVFGLPLQVSSLSPLPLL